MLFLNSYDLPFSFTQVASGLFQKYPNPCAPHVKSVDVLSCTVQPGNVLRTERLIGVEQSCPAWILRLLGGTSKAWIRETIFISLSTGTETQHRIISSSANLTMSSILSLRETISYEPTSPSTTTFSALADARAGASAIVKKQVERWSIDRYMKNAHVGKEGFLEVLERMWKDATSSSSEAETSRTQVA